MTAHSQSLPSDPEVLRFIERSNSFYPSNWQALSLEENRQCYARYAQALRAALPACVATADEAVSAAAPPRQLPARWYRRTDLAGPAPAVVLYLHGGGFVLGGLDSHADVCAGLCEQSGLDLFAATYRLAPEHQHPAQLDDAQAALDHLLQRGRPVILAGDSAGANLAAALALRHRTHGGQIIGQVLIYPALGGDSSRGSYLTHAQAPLLSTADCHHCFTVRGGVGVGVDGSQAWQCEDPELMPLRASSFAQLPPAFVVTADIDPLRDDGQAYVERLQAAGVLARWRNEPELVHGYLRARHMSRRAAQSFAAIAAALAAMAAGAFD